MELLAPAGTLSAFEAAIEEGADAVYVGAPGLNARALTRDFTHADIGNMTKVAHERGRRLYVAMNSLMKEEEIRLALETLTVLADIGPDGLIIQDLGILSLVRRFFPGLPVHASTLMTVNNALGAEYCRRLGFARVVLARELSLDEILTIHHRTGVELEIFIHGAMCFSYSGLCRFSSLHGGKSSLRGQCVQPCRRRYDWLPSGKRAGGGLAGKSGGYLFSMHDLCGIDHLAEARAAGVVSLKIEGRLKPVEYVRNTVRAYRLALDAIDAPLDRRAGVMEEAHRLLDAAMGRRRSTGFLVAGRSDRLIGPKLSGSTGTVVGKVVRLITGKAGGGERAVALQVALRAPIRQGDRLRLYAERTGERISFTLRFLERNGRNTEQAQAGQTVIIKVPDIDPRSLKQPFHGTVFRVDTGERSSAPRSGTTARTARIRLPVVDSVLLSQRLKLLGLVIEAGAPPTNRRRNAGTGVQATLGERGGPEWWLKVHSPEALVLRYPFRITRVVVDLTERNIDLFHKSRRQRGAEALPLVWALPPVLSEEQMSRCRELIDRLRLQGEHCFQVGHIGQTALFNESDQSPERQSLQLYGDASCNALNSAALHQYAESGLAGVQFSLETDRPNLAGALAHFARTEHGRGDRRMGVGLLVYGRPPLFSARLDAPHFQGQRTFVSPRGERFYLDRRAETLHVSSHLPFSLLAYAEELTRLGIDYFVVDVAHGQPKKEAAQLATLFSGHSERIPVLSGNYAGTLA